MEHILKTEPVGPFHRVSGATQNGERRRILFVGRLNLAGPSAMGARYLFRDLGGGALVRPTLDAALLRRILHFAGPRGPPRPFKDLALGPSRARLCAPPLRSLPDICVGKRARDYAFGSIHVVSVRRAYSHPIVDGVGKTMIPMEPINRL